MSVPQVNQGVTDENRRQTRRIAGLKGYDGYNELFQYQRSQAPDADIYDTIKKDRPMIRCPQGSFTLDQVVGMLEAEGVHYNPKRRQWVRGNMIKIADCSPHDLTAAMDALIKVLEEKQ